MLHLVGHFSKKNLLFEFRVIRLILLFYCVVYRIGKEISHIMYILHIIASSYILVSVAV